VGGDALMLRLLGLIGFTHLREHPIRIIVTAIGISLGVALSVAIRSANDEVLKSFQEAVAQVAGRATLQVSAGEAGVDEQVITDLRRHPSVLLASPVVHQAVQVGAGPHAGRAFQVLGLDLLEAVTLKDFSIADPGEEEASLEPLLELNAVFLGRRLAADLNVTVGQRLEVLVGTHRYPLVVRGLITGSGQRSVWQQLAVMDIAAAQMVFGAVGRLDRIELVTDPKEPIADTVAALQGLLPSRLTVARPAQRNEQIERLLRAMRVNLATLGAVGLLIGLLLIYNTVSFAVVQRRPEIGMFRALGMTRRTVVCLFLAEAALLGLVGGLTGSGLGILFARALVMLLRQTVSELHGSVELTAADGTWDLMGRMDLWREGFLLGLVVAVLGALAPAIDAGRTSPARALAQGEYEARQELRVRPLMRVGALCLSAAGLLALPGPIAGIPVWGYGSALLLLLGLSCLAPAVVVGFGRTSPGWSLSDRSSTFGIIGRIAVDQIARAPGRNSVTVAALMVGLAVMVGVGVMIHSFRHSVEHWIHQTILADLVVAPARWLHGDEREALSRRIPLTWRDAVSRVDGVAAVDPYRELSVPIGDRTVSLVSRDLALHAERSRYLFTQGDSREILGEAVASEGIVVSEVLAHTLGVKRGHELAVRTPSGIHTFPVVGIFYDYATDGGKIVMDSALYRRLWQDETATVLAVYLEPGTPIEDVRERIVDAMRPEMHAVVIGNAELRAEILAIFDRTFRVTYALELIAMVIALLGIFNTLLTSVLERRRELASLRATGASQGQIALLVLWESFWLGCLGVVMGLVGGLLLSVLLVEVINKQSFGWTIQYVVPPGLLIQTVILALGIALAAGYLPARWAARQTIAEGLRYE
jgi:putative ABC transport system permease protein